ncbi:UDP-glucoronosyl and UDP-glucosyl transferase [Apiospora marii]|uniref:UDP-glucoronosyl and UDP-glucosyl transferase n=1 Tax=Apiospora marii TaxID=335849 RepID=A0ABR1SHK7_9PEZI
MKLLFWDPWKLTKRGQYGAAEKDSRIHSVLEEDLDNYRVRTVPWLHSEPSAILTEPSIICSVDHGGANSFLEAVRQVISPTRHKLFIGYSNNKANNTCFRTAGVPQIVLPVWIDCLDFAIRAEELAEICRRGGGVQVVAARTIIEHVQTWISVKQGFDLFLDEDEDH